MTIASELSPFGAGSAVVTSLTDSTGALLAVPQPFDIPEVTAIEYDFKADVKSLVGKGSYPIRLAHGKKTASIKITAQARFAKLLNAIFYGTDLATGADHIYIDKNGKTIPSQNGVVYKIKECITFFLGKWVSDTQVKVNGIVATEITNATSKLTAGQYRIASGVYQFATADNGKTAALTYVVGGGVSVVSTFKIPPALVWNANAFYSNTSVKKTNNTWVRDTYNAAAVAPIANHYQVSPSGVYIFNSTNSGASDFVITHVTSGVSVATVVATFPAAGYGFIVDPPGSMNYVDTVSVVLNANTGTAMTDVAVGENLTQSAEPTSGQYDVDSTGIYIFAAADVGDTVNIFYQTDWSFIAIAPPQNGDFLDIKGLRNQDGEIMTRVAFVTPISLSRNQYMVDANGTCYFDTTNFGETVYISYSYHTDQGVTLTIDNDDMGSGPTVLLDLQFTDEGVLRTLSGMRGKCKGDSLKTKQDDFSPIDIEFEVMAHPVTRIVATYSESTL
ncbi:hypothetical protein KFZ76_11840 [Methylovulum psychrotolerans]|uniref:hypothetical protein n=1 Tax=Methylovulum psychrotolerans TaxID=1704499 RepID=UPI001BFF4248|nr:hypothetical protein [Methylovulum psychrotolerans]MBT9098398.1 hypothetical protein [Methylovulum psychrotolerans]